MPTKQFLGRSEDLDSLEQAGTLGNGEAYQMSCEPLTGSYRDQ